MVRKSAAGIGVPTSSSPASTSHAEPQARKRFLTSSPGIGATSSSAESPTHSTAPPREILDPSSAPHSSSNPVSKPPSPVIAPTLSSSPQTPSSPSSSPFLKIVHSSLALPSLSPKAWGSLGPRARDWAEVKFSSICSSLGLPSLPPKLSSMSLRHVPRVLRSFGPYELGALGLILLLLPFSLQHFYRQWNHTLLRSPVCRGSTLSGKGLPKLVLLLGPEGGGHDLLETVFSALPTSVAITRFDPNLHLTTGPTQETPPADHSDPPKRFCPKLPYARRVHDFGMHISGDIKEKAQVVSKDAAYVRVRDPMPMGRVRTPLARPDPVSIGTFHGLYYDLKAIVLVRNLTSCVSWSVSRNFHNEDVGLQLRLLEDSLTFLDASIRTLPCSTYAILDIDWIMQYSARAAGQLADFLDLPRIGRSEMVLAMQVALSRWDKGMPKGDAGESSMEISFGGQKVDYFFSQRTFLWPLLTAARGRSVFIPSSPSAWPGSF